jgi:hypothetical protein
MTRVQWVTLGAYAALMYTALGPPFQDGTFALLTLAAAHVGLGVGVGRWWVLLVPIAVATAGVFLATDDFGLLALFGGPVAVLLTATGRGFAYGPPRFRVGVAGFCALLCVLTAGASVVEEVREGPPLPAAVQRQLPIDVSLVVLCPYEDVNEAERPRARAALEVLLRELRERPNHTVTYTFYWAHSEEEVREITVRELAEVTLDDLEHGDARGPCAPEVRKRLSAAL